MEYNHTNKKTLEERSIIKLQIQFSCRILQLTLEIESKDTLNIDTNQHGDKIFTLVETKCTNTLNEVT